MNKLIAFAIGIIAGLALAATLYLQASAKFHKAQEGGENASALYQEAQMLWPPYMMDAGFQENTKTTDKRKDTEDADITIILTQDTTEAEVESLVNQIEITEGVESVQWNTLARPKEFISNMTDLPSSDEDIRDHIAVDTLDENATDRVIEFTKLQEIVESVSVGE